MLISKFNNYKNYFSYLLQNHQIYHDFPSNHTKTPNLTNFNFVIQYIIRSSPPNLKGEVSNEEAYKNLQSKKE